MSAKLTTEGEKAWSKLRYSFDWSDDFALYFYFTDYPEVSQILYQRLENQVTSRATKLQYLEYQSDDENWVDTILNRFLNPNSDWLLLKCPVWLALNQQTPQAIANYQNLLTRLNERRDLWRKYYPAFFIIELPVKLRSKIPSLMPDLWSVRVSSEILPRDYYNIDSYNKKTPDSGLKILVDNWESKAEQFAANRELSTTSRNELIKALHTVGNFLELQGRLQDARSAYEEEEYHNRRKVDLLGVNTDSLEGLITALEKVADIAQKQGRLQDAQVVYDEVVYLTRRKIELQGVTPKSLHELGVCLTNRGYLAQLHGRWQDAKSAYEEALFLNRRRAILLGNSTEALFGVRNSLNHVGNVTFELASWSDLSYLKIAQSAYEESLSISRRLCEVLGESPESLRDLSVSLDNVGKVAQQDGRWRDAQGAYEESLRISRRLSEVLGESPESLRDLAISLCNLGDWHKEQNQIEQATVYYKEGQLLGERLVKVCHGIPSYEQVKRVFEQRLQDLIKVK